jgi:hypothetical protein
MADTKKETKGTDKDERVITASSKTCFVICPIGDSDTVIRKRSDQLLRHIIEPAAREAGYGANLFIALIGCLNPELSRDRLLSTF